MRIARLVTTTSEVASIAFEGRETAARERGPRFVARGCLFVGSRRDLRDLYVAAPPLGCAYAEVRAFRVSETDLNSKTECPRAVKLGAPTEEEQGELCYRGRNIMVGVVGPPPRAEFVFLCRASPCLLATATTTRRRRDRRAWRRCGGGVVTVW